MPGFYATIARYYDAENTDKTDDLAMYSDLAKKYGDPILDIGAGTGRVVIHLAQEEYKVYGIEREAAMLERAEQKLAAFPHLREYVTLIEGDSLTYKLDQQFKMILLTYNMLMHFHEQEQQITLLRRLREALAPDGVLVIDLPNAGLAFASEDTDAITLERTFIEPENGHLVMQQSVSLLDRVEQLLRVTWIYDEVTEDGMVRRTYAPTVLRYYFYSELSLLLTTTGFAIEVVHGDTEGGEFADGCDRMIVLAKPI